MLAYLVMNGEHIEMLQQESAVVGVPDEEAGEIPKAFIVLYTDISSRVTAEGLITSVNGKLTGYKKLREVEFVETLPKLASCKILRRELKALERVRHAGEPVSYNS